jgi:hypothetical protein
MFSAAYCRLRAVHVCALVQDAVQLVRGTAVAPVTVVAHFRTRDIKRAVDIRSFKISQARDVDDVIGDCGLHSAVDSRIASTQCGLRQVYQFPPNA